MEGEIVQSYRTLMSNLIDVCGTVHIVHWRALATCGCLKDVKRVDMKQVLSKWIAFCDPAGCIDGRRLGIVLPVYTNVDLPQSTIVNSLIDFSSEAYDGSFDVTHNNGEVTRKVDLYFIWESNTGESEVKGGSDTRAAISTSLLLRLCTHAFFMYRNTGLGAQGLQESQLLSRSPVRFVMVPQESAASAIEPASSEKGSSNERQSYDEFGPIPDRPR